MQWRYERSQQVLQTSSARKTKTNKTERGEKHTHKMIIVEADCGAILWRHHRTLCTLTKTVVTNGTTRVLLQSGG